jgi:succinate dehydrogenase / fumarate reductase flavoprotein subunit
MELEGMIDMALCVGLGALARQESRGAHYRTDYSTRDDVHWLKHTLAYYQPEAPSPRLDSKPVTLGYFELQERKY